MVAAVGDSVGGNDVERLGALVSNNVQFSDGVLQLFVVHFENEPARNNGDASISDRVDVIANPYCAMY